LILGILNVGDCVSTKFLILRDLLMKANYLAVV